MRQLTARSLREGLRHRAEARVGVGLPATGVEPLRRLIATLPALEVPRPDWPREAVVVGPLHFEPTSAELAPPPGDGPVVVVAPSTATTGTQGLAEMALECLVPGKALPDGCPTGGVATRGRRSTDSAVGGRSGSGGRTGCCRAPTSSSAVAATAW